MPDFEHNSRYAEMCRKVTCPVLQIIGKSEDIDKSKKTYLEHTRVLNLVVFLNVTAQY